MSYSDFQKSIEAWERQPRTPEERAAGIFSRLLAFLSQPETPKKEHDETVFVLNNPMAPDVNEVHAEFLRLLGASEPRRPGKEEGYHTVNEVVYETRGGTIVRQTINLAEDPQYPGCHPEAMFVNYTAQRGAALHPRVRDVAELAVTSSR